MAYVQQVCEGYNKKSLMGNWYEERLYPEQAFREKQEKKAREKDQGITCFDNTGFQRSLPRIQRRGKWETAGRIILNDGLNEKVPVMKAEYPHGEQQSTVAEMRRPFDKNSTSIHGTNVHPHSELKNVQKSYHYINDKNAEQLKNQRQVQMYRSDFKSDLPQHPRSIHETSFQTIYKEAYVPKTNENKFEKTSSDFNRTQQSAGHFNPTKEETIKNISTMVGEYKKEVGDEKERTDIQRSWVPPRDDPGFKNSVGKTMQDFKYSSLPKNDIQTSLNMNIGVQNIHPKNVTDNYFRHVRQDVTLTHNHSLCPRP